MAQKDDSSFERIVRKFGLNALPAEAERYRNKGRRVPARQRIVSYFFVFKAVFTQLFIKQPAVDAQQFGRT
jgi:hypothetical protein